MSLNPCAPTSRPTAPKRTLLTAHTERANALAEKLFQGKINQEEYDAQTFSTTILSAEKLASVPIVLTLDDTLDTLQIYAHRKFKIPSTKVETTNLYVLWSKKVFYAAAAHVVPENMELLDQDNLNMILTFMKASPQVEQLVVKVAEDVKEGTIERESTAVEINRFGDEDDTPAKKEGRSIPTSAKDRSSQTEKERSTVRKGKEREDASGFDRNPRDLVQGYEENLDLRGDESRVRVSRAKEQGKQQGPQVRGKSRVSGSSSGKPTGSGKGSVKEEKHGSRRGGR